MLTVLRVRNFAIIDEVEVALGPGLNVVTGETGAGKSILVDALHLVLGARARPEVIRAGADQAEVEALFCVDPVRMGPRLEAMGLPAEEELLVRRLVLPQGRSRAYVNGHLATASQLALLAQGLVDICSQHEHHTLVDPASHLGHLDDFAALPPVVVQVGRAHAAAAAAVAALDRARAALAERGEREERLRFQLAELDRLAPQPDEEESLRAERERLVHAERLAQAAGGAEHALYSADEAITATLSQLCQELRQASRHDPALAELAGRLDGARLELEEAARDLGAYARAREADPVRLLEVEERMHALRGLARRYGGSVESACRHAEQAREELLALDAVEERVEALEAAVAEALGQARAVAGRLSRERHAHARALGEAISQQLDGLGMGGARVQVEVAPVGEARPGELSLDGARLTPHGIDRAEFLIAPNPGEEPRPLRRVASGGELSRALLALKCVLGGVDPDGLYVFDEVDAGVGGAVAEVIGQKLRGIGQRHQVLCITHLPQIAAYGDRHFRVDKIVAEGRTRSRIVALDEDERREEVARMLGGIRITDASRLAAQALLQAAG